MSWREERHAAYSSNEDIKKANDVGGGVRSRRGRRGKDRGSVFWQVGSESILDVIISVSPHRSVGIYRLMGDDRRNLKFNEND